MFLIIDGLKNFANFTGKHHCLESLFNKVADLKETPTQVFSSEMCEIFKDTFFYRTPPVAASDQTYEISVVHCVAKVFFCHLEQVNLGCPISC